MIYPEQLDPSYFGAAAESANEWYKNSVVPYLSRQEESRQDNRWGAMRDSVRSFGFTMDEASNAFRNFVYSQYRPTRRSTAYSAGDYAIYLPDNFQDDAPYMIPYRDSECNYGAEGTIHFVNGLILDFRGPVPAGFMIDCEGRLAILSENDVSEMSEITRSVDGARNVIRQYSSPVPVNWSGDFSELSVTRQIFRVSYYEIPRAVARQSSSVDFALLRYIGDY